MKANDWVGKRVRQSTANEGFEKFVGRVAKVTEAFEDVNGNVQVHTDDDVWCPAVHLEPL